MDTAEPMDAETPNSTRDKPTVTEAATNSGSKSYESPGKVADVPKPESTPAVKKRSAPEAADGDKVGVVSSAAAKPKRSKPASGPASLSGVRAYLETAVVPLLMTALQELATQKPDDPLTWLGDFLKDNAAKGNQDVAEAARKREAASAAKAAAAVPGSASKDPPAASKLPGDGGKSAAAGKAEATRSDDAKATEGAGKTSTLYSTTTAQPEAAQALAPKVELATGALPSAADSAAAATSDLGPNAAAAATGPTS